MKFTPNQIKISLLSKLLYTIYFCNSFQLHSICFLYFNFTIKAIIVQNLSNQIYLSINNRSSYTSILIFKQERKKRIEKPSDLKIHTQNQFTLIQSQQPMIFIQIVRQFFRQYCEKSMASFQLKITEQNTLTVLEQMPKKVEEPLQIKEKQVIRLKSQQKIISIGLIVSLGALIFGYGLKQITSVPISKITLEYNISLNKFAAQSILIGIMPLGCIVGAILTKFLIKKFRRLSPIKFFALVNIGAIVLVNINNFASLIIGRFIEGICIGYYSSIAPIYLREIAPKQMRRMLGLFFAFGRIIGVLVVIILQLIFNHVTIIIGYRIILSLTAAFSTLMTILILLFCPCTPTELIQIGDQQSAKKIIKQLYKQSYAQQIFNQYKKEVETEKAKIQDVQIDQKKQQKYIQNRNQNIKNLPKIDQQNTLSNINEIDENKQTHIVKQQSSLQAKRKSAFCVGIHLCFIRHGTGGVIMITQGGLFINTFNKNLGEYTSLIINSVQLLFIIIGIIVVQKYIGKRPLFLFSITLMSLINIGLSIAMIHQHVLSSMFLMILFMMIYGGSFVSPVWSYPSQVIPASKALIPNITHWLGLSITTLIPPLVTGVMPKNNPFPVFIVLGVYGLLSLVHIFKDLRESDGKTYNQIIQTYK